MPLTLINKQMIKQQQTNSRIPVYLKTHEDISFRNLNMIALTFLCLLLTLVHPSQANSAQPKAQICQADTQYVKRKLGSEVTEDICQQHQHKVMLIVNTASRCAYTDQYDGLEKLYKVYKDRGLVVLGFPSNDFGHQEPGSEESIKSFCRLTYGVKFPMYAKTSVNGSAADPLYKALSKAAGESPRWNFHKYLLNRKGELIGSYGSAVTPSSKALLNAIEKAL